MSRQRLPFTRLQAFEAVARLGSFNAAMQELGGSNVSKHVSALQDELGLCLVKRSPRGALTYEGRVLASILTHHFDDIAAVLEDLRAGQFQPETAAMIIALRGSGNSGDR